MLKAECINCLPMNLHKYQLHLCKTNTVNH